MRKLYHHKITENSTLNLDEVSKKYQFDLAESTDVEAYVDANDVVIVESDSPAELKSFLSINQLKIESILFIAMDLSLFDSSSEKDLTNIFSYNIGIKGLIDISKPIELAFPLFNSLRNIESDISLKDLTSISQELSVLVETSMTELYRVKKLHQKLVPIREDEFKGLKFSSKFGAGEKSGGDFFDFIKLKYQSLLILASTNSYLITSSIMAKIESFRAMNSLTLDDLKSFLISLKEDVVQFGRSEADFSIDLLLFDMKKGKLIGLHFGQSEFLFQDKQIDESEFTLDLIRGERYYLTSEGAFKNIPAGIEGTSFQDVLKANREKDPKEYLNESMLKVKSQFDQKFLNYDTTFIVIEVPKNVFFEV